MATVMAAIIAESMPVAFITAQVDTVSNIANEFVKQGGAYALLVLVCALGVWAVTRLFNTLEARNNKIDSQHEDHRKEIIALQEARINDMREVARQAVEAVQSLKLIQETQTRASEANVRLGEANGKLTQTQGETISALVASVNRLTTAFENSGIGRRQ